MFTFGWPLGNKRRLVYVSFNSTGCNAVEVCVTHGELEANRYTLLNVVCCRNMRELFLQIPEVEQRAFMRELDLYTNAINEFIEG